MASWTMTTSGGMTSPTESDCSQLWSTNVAVQVTKEVNSSRMNSCALISARSRKRELVRIVPLRVPVTVMSVVPVAPGSFDDTS